MTVREIAQERPRNHFRAHQQGRGEMAHVRRPTHARPTISGVCIEMPDGSTIAATEYKRLRRQGPMRLNGGKIQHCAEELRAALPSDQWVPLVKWMVNLAEGRELKERLKSHFVAVLVLRAAEHLRKDPTEVYETMVSTCTAKGVLLPR